MLFRTSPSRLVIWAALFALPSFVWASPILDPGAPGGLTLYSLSSVPGFSSQFPNGYFLEGLAINGGNLLVSIADPTVVTHQTVWSMPLVRNDGHITSVGAATLYASVPSDIAGNLPGGGLIPTANALLYTTQAESLFGQYVSPSASSLLAIHPISGGTIGGMNYIPAGQTGAGLLELSSSSQDGTWYTMTVNGTPGSYTISSLVASATGAPAYSFAYLPADATFNFPSVVLGDGTNLDLYHLDGAGNPCTSTTAGCASVVHLVDSVDSFIGYGVVRDPVSGDILFTTGNNLIWVVSDTIPEPSTMVLAIGGMALLAGFAGRTPRSARVPLDPLC